jgi:hypothetical protein
MEETLAGDKLRGVAAIAAFLGESRRRAQYLCEKRLIPVGKEGAIYVASKRTLRAHYEYITSGEAAQCARRKIARRQCR